MTNLPHFKTLTSRAERFVALIAFNGTELLDIVGPLSVFSKANVIIPGSYRTCVLSSEGRQKASNAGMPILPEASWRSIPSHQIDTLIIPGGHEDVVLKELLNADLIDWIKSVALSARRVASICTGAFALCQAGLLNGRHATTHWSSCELLKSKYPEVNVEKNSIYVRDGRIWTSAGILTGIDLALAMVEEDLGRECAQRIAALIVSPGMRPGESPQRSPLLNNQAHASRPLANLLSWIQLHLSESIRPEQLAERMGVSTRQLSRIFDKELGLSPSKYLMIVRLDHAEKLLRTTSWSIFSVASKSGFHSVDTLQRAFMKRWKCTPYEYRNNPSKATADRTIKIKS